MRSSSPAGGRLRLCLILLPLVCAALLGSARTVHAQHVQGGVIGGYGVNTTPVDHDPYLFTIGAQAGVTLPVFPLYLGARLMWFSGEITNVQLDNSMGQTALSFSLNYLMLGADLGYDLEVGPIVLRPMLGAGRATLSGKLIGAQGIINRPVDNSPFIAPALALLDQRLLPVRERRAPLHVHDRTRQPRRLRAALRLRRADLKVGLGPAAQPARQRLLRDRTHAVAARRAAARAQEVAPLVTGVIRGVGRARGSRRAR